MTPWAMKMQNPKLQWAKSSQLYDTIGHVGYVFATLTNHKARIPRPAAPPRFVVEKGDDNLEVVINAPSGLYIKRSVNVDKRPDWLEGVDTINRDMTSERINMRHNCVFHGMTLVNTALYRDFSENHARYSEKVEIPAINLTLLAHYEMEALGEASTRLNFNVNWMGAKLPAEKKQGMMAGQATNFEFFKHVRDQPSLADRPLWIHEPLPGTIG